MFFAFGDYYPNGGMNDFIDSYEKISDIVVLFKDNKEDGFELNLDYHRGDSYFQIFDTAQLKTVYEFNTNTFPEELKQYLPKTADEKNTNL